jgi:hypothetical protein
MALWDVLVMRRLRAAQSWNRSVSSITELAGRVR